jgi:hypothetical protein
MHNHPTPNAMKHTHKIKHRREKRNLNIRWKVSRLRRNKKICPEEQ